MGHAKKIVKAISEELERFGKTAVEQIVGPSEKPDNTDKILPPAQKQQIKTQEASRLAEINQQIAAIRKKKEQESKGAGEQEKKIAKKYEEKKKQQDKWAVLKNMIKNQQGSKESGNIRASG
jgi:leucyl aminopeptidase (aminopeptidase T)